jgi:hypothetical protein
MRFLIVLLSICLVYGFPIVQAAEKGVFPKISHHFSNDDFKHYNPREISEFCSERVFDNDKLDDEIYLAQTKCGAMLQFYNYNYTHAYHTIAKMLPPVEQHHILEEAYRCNRLPVFDTKKSMDKFRKNLSRSLVSEDIEIGLGVFIYTYDLYKRYGSDCYNKYEIGHKDFSFQRISDFIDSTCLRDDEERYCRHLIESYFDVRIAGLYAYSLAQDYFPEKDEFGLAKRDSFDRLAATEEYKAFLYPDFDEDIYSQIYIPEREDITTLKILDMWKSMRNEEVDKDLSLYAYLVNFNMAMQKADEIRRCKSITAKTKECEKYQ